MEVCEICESEDDFPVEKGAVENLVFEPLVHPKWMPQLVV